MRNTFLSLICLIYLFGCSTNNGVTTVVPVAPTNLTGTAISGTQINLSWTDNSTNEVGYKVQRKTAGGSFADVGSTGTDMSTFSDLGLTNNTAYTYRVYAYNAAGNSLQYSNEITITTTTGGGGGGGSAVTDIDGNIYPTVQICNQTWTAKNLDVSHYRNGDVISQVTDSTTWANLTTGAWCYYQNNTANGPIYGKLYNWYAVNDPRGLAPQGYHVPSDTEWSTVVNCLGGSSVAGGAMKEAGLIHWGNPNTGYSGGSNSSGFTALPGGIRVQYGYNSQAVLAAGLFGNINYDGIWWTSTDTNSPSAWAYDMVYESNGTDRFDKNKAVGISVRCVKD